MTDNAFLPPAEDESQTGGSRRTVLVAGGLAVAVALAGGGYLLLSGGSSTPAASQSVALPGVAHLPSTATKPASTKAVAKRVVLVPAVSTVPLGRDPFKPLYIVPVVAPATAAPTTTSTTGTPTSTTPATTVPATHTVKLTSVYGTGTNTTGVFAVDTKTQLARAGSVFGPTQEVKLLSLTRSASGVWTASLQVGDGQPFDAPTGQTMYVQ